MDNINNFYYINLDKDTQKNKTTLKSFEDIQIYNPIRIPGILGSSLSKDEISKYTSFKCSMLCAYSMIGCAMSHLKAWNAMMNNNDEYAIICEDDIEFCPEFREKFDYIWNFVPKDFDILFLGCFVCNKNFSLMNIFLNTAESVDIESVNYKNQIYNIKKPKISLATHCYILSKQGCRKLIELINKTKIFYHIDVQLNEYASKKLINRYVILPSLVGQSSTQNTEESSNVNNFPLLLNKAIPKNFQLFDDVSFYYNMNVVLGQIGEYKINIWSLVFLVLGILLSTIELKYLLLSFLIIFIPDIIYSRNIKITLVNICVTLFLLISPRCYKISSYFGIENKQKF